MFSVYSPYFEMIILKNKNKNKDGQQMFLTTHRYVFLFTILLPHDITNQDFHQNDIHIFVCSKRLNTYENRLVKYQLQIVRAHLRTLKH